MFDIRTLDFQSGTIAIVTAISYVSPLSSLSALQDIQQELSVKLGDNINGEVIFDLACSNGLEWNRFLSLKMSDGQFEVKTAKVIDQSEISSNLIEKQASIFKSNPQYLQDSVLTKEDLPRIVAA
jgi:hypothetical protein